MINLKLNNMPPLVRVKVVNKTGEWYIGPDELYVEFHTDYLTEIFSLKSIDFDAKWGKYKTGVDLNLVQLWAEI